MGSATGAAGTEIDTAVELEAHGRKIDFNRLGFLQKFRIDKVLKAIDLKDAVGVLRLIQSHGQGRTASAAGVEKNSDRGNLFVFKVRGNLFGRRRGYFNHDRSPLDKNFHLYAGD